jgi:hypothetical protein
MAAIRRSSNVAAILSIGAALGWVLLVLGVTILVGEIARWYMTGAYRPLSAGTAWFDFDPASLNLMQAVIQRYIHPSLWDPIITAVLHWPLWSLLAGPGAFLAVALPLRSGRLA